MLKELKNLEWVDCGLIHDKVVKSLYDHQNRRPNPNPEYPVQDHMQATAVVAGILGTDWEKGNG